MLLFQHKCRRTALTELDKLQDKVKIHLSVLKLLSYQKKEENSWLGQKAEPHSLFQILNLEGNEGLGRNSASAVRLEI